MVQLIVENSIVVPKKLNTELLHEPLTEDQDSQNMNFYDSVRKR